MWLYERVEQVMGDRSINKLSCVFDTARITRVVNPFYVPLSMTLKTSK